MDWVALRFSLWVRSGGRCEFCRDPIRDSAEVHHRRLRSQGGGHDEGNLVLVHPRCHRWAHSNPAAARDLGWLVHGWEEPTSIRVVTGKPWAQM